MHSLMPSFLLFIFITMVTGFIDSLGFVYAAQIWQETISWLALTKSALCFAVGIGLYWLSLRYITQLGINTPELQVAIWFGVTLIGVAIVSGRFFNWLLLDQVVALSVLGGITWLLIRVGE